MSVQPFGTPIFQAFDSNGAPLSGGLLYTFAGGTSTPQATYTDSTGTVANANPVVLDSKGEAQVWMTAGVLYKFVLQNSSAVQQWSVDNYPSPAAAATGSTSVAANDPGGRLTLSSTLPVTTADLTVQGTIYYLPYKSDQVPLYNGSNWSLYSIPGGGTSQSVTDTLKSPAAAVANSCYDLFLWLDGSTIRCTRGPPWSSDTVRGSGAGTTQLTQLNGRWVNAQPITNGPGVNLGLYAGTIRTDAGGNANDSLRLRHVWNNYNRVARPMRVTDATASWTYGTPTIRQANASIANQLDYVVGLAEDGVDATVLASVGSSTAGNQAQIGIGVDSTTALSSLGGSCQWNGVATLYHELVAQYRGIPGLGRHYLAWLEWSSAAGPTFQGTGGFTTATGSASGITGEMRG